MFSEKPPEGPVPVSCPCYPPGMAWIIGTTLDERHVNLQVSQIAAILDRVPKRPQEGCVVILAGSGETLELRESPAELLRSAENEEHPENTSAQPGNVW